MLTFLISESLLDGSRVILKDAYIENKIEFVVSGSSSQYINGTRQLTKPEYAFDQIPKDYDWCSNCGRSKEEHPFIIFNIKDNFMNLQGYYLKSGCCGGDLKCCCIEDDFYCCDCCLYSWSLQISNDNSTWKTIHKVEKDIAMTRCKDKIYKFSEQYTTKYVRLIQDEACPGDPPCIAINKIEFIGDLSNSYSESSEMMDVDEDDVSIIGHISKKL